MALKDWLNPFLNLFGLGYEINKDQHLTGAQREANDFSAQQAEMNRNFQMAEAEKARAWQEEQYLKYNSPGALVRQYGDAGINPALMFGGQTPPASTSTSAPAGASAASVAPSGGNLIGMLDSLMKLSLLGEEKRNLELRNEGQLLANAGADLANGLVSRFGASEAEARINQMNKSIDKMESEIGVNNTVKALNRASAALARARANGEKLLNTEREWTKKFIEEFHVTPQLAGDIIGACGDIIGAGIGGLWQNFLKSKGVKTTTTSFGPKGNTYSETTTIPLPKK